MHINSSRLSTFNTCKRKFYWEYVHGGHGLRPTYPNDKLVWGILAHEGLAALYKGQSLGQAMAYVRDYAMEKELPWDALTADEKNFWLDQIEWINQTLKVYDPWRKEHDKFQVLEVESEGECVVGEVCYECGAEYTKESREAGYCVAQVRLEGDGGNGVTMKCRTPLHYFVYRVDLAVNHMGAMKIIDHKTTGSASSNYMQSWDHSFQLALYTYGYKKALQGDDPDPPEIGGYGMNIIKKLKTIGEEAPLTKKCPECNQGKRKQPHCTFCERTGVVPRAPQKRDEPFIRLWPPYNNDKEVRMIMQRLLSIQEIERQAERFESEPEASYPMNDRACFFPTKCPFWKLCYEGDPIKWQAPSQPLIEACRLQPQKEDYVTQRAMIREEMS
jgi:hypothetical protein